jgi:hypothetical protein
VADLNPDRSLEMLVKVNDEVQIRSINTAYAGIFGTVEKVKDGVDGPYLVIRVVNSYITVKTSDVIVVSKPHRSCY